MNKTKINIIEDRFLINNEITYKGKYFKEKSIEGLLFNSRMVNAIFDDENNFTKKLWKYPDTNITIPIGHNTIPINRDHPPMPSFNCSIFGTCLFPSWSSSNSIQIINIVPINKYVTIKFIILCCF